MGQGSILRDCCCKQAKSQVTRSAPARPTHLTTRPCRRCGELRPGAPQTDVFVPPRSRSPKLFRSEVTSNQECARKAHTSDHSALSQMWRVTPWCSTNGRFCTASKPIPEVVDFKQSVGCQLEHRFWNGPLAGSQHSTLGLVNSLAVLAASSIVTASSA